MREQERALGSCKKSSSQTENTKVGCCSLWSCFFSSPVVLLFLWRFLHPSHFTCRKLYPWWFLYIMSCLKSGMPLVPGRCEHKDLHISPWNWILNSDFDFLLVRIPHHHPRIVAITIGIQDSLVGRRAQRTVSQSLSCMSLGFCNHSQSPPTSQLMPFSLVPVSHLIFMNSIDALLPQSQSSLSHRFSFLCVRTMASRLYVLVMNCWTSYPESHYIPS